MPGEGVVIKRPHMVVVKGVNQYFRPVRYRLSGLQARIACHEIDLLLGKLIIDYKEER
ncbi:Peptide deformylase [subsurface metagenome]